jgi:hypothetical protein
VNDTRKGQPVVVIGGSGLGHETAGCPTPMAWCDTKNSIMSIADSDTSLGRQS